MKEKLIKYEIDAAGQSLGRVASRVAGLLRGKNRPQFTPHLAPPVAVTIVNVSQITLPAKKRRQKVYRRYSGYPGGLRQETLESLIGRRGYAAPLLRAVAGMLPANRLRPRLLKNLIIKE